MLKPWARAVVSLWVLVVVPMLAFSLFTMVVTLPRIARHRAGSAPQAVARCSAMPGATADFLEVAARGDRHRRGGLPGARDRFHPRPARAPLGGREDPAPHEGQAGPARASPACVAAALVAGLACAVVAARGHVPPDPALRGRHPGPGGAGTAPRAVATGLVARAARHDSPPAGATSDARPTTAAAAAGPGAGPARRDRVPARTRARRHKDGRQSSRGCSRSTSRWRPARATTRHGGQHHRQHHPVRRGVRAGLGRRRLPRPEHQRGLRLRQLRQLRRRLGRRSRSCWSPATTTSRHRRTSRPRSTTTASTA